MNDTPILTAGRKQDRADLMRAMFLEKNAGAESLELGLIPMPVAGCGQVLIQVHATAVTPTELQWWPTFHLPSGEPRPFPVVLGHELSGTVKSVGPEVRSLSDGDEVYGLNDWFSNGAQAEYCVAAAAGLTRKPGSLDHVRSAAAPLSALTAWQGLFERCQLKSGDRVLIHGAAGAVGLFALQLALWRGAHVIATASGARAEFVRSLGAHEVLDYKRTRLEEIGPTLDVVFDTVGGETLARSWALLSRGGRLVTVAAQSEGGTDPRVGEAFMLVRADGAQLSEITQLLESGILRVFVEDTFPLDQARQAYARAQLGGMRGKVVLRVVQ